MWSITGDVYHHSALTVMSVRLDQEGFRGSDTPYEMLLFRIGPVVQPRPADEIIGIFGNGHVDNTA